MTIRTTTVDAIVVLIPAYNPTQHLIDLVEEVCHIAVRHIIVVDDGSHAESQPFFSQLETLPNCTVLRHTTNLGKGCALKTGFKYILQHWPTVAGVVTTDCDGQHLTADIARVADVLSTHGSSLVLGVRTFGTGTPLRSFIGNLFTRTIFRLVSGIKVSDTQTGLRGVPSSLLEKFLEVPGDRYEYEMRMLMSANTHKFEIVEEPITTVYLDNNRSSHFNPLWDSMKIYIVLLRFVLSSILASLLDLAVFSISYYVTKNILTSLIYARIVASIVNFLCNRDLVFRQQEHAISSVVRYYLLTIMLMLVSWYAISFLTQYTHWNVILVKILVEFHLFIINFIVQHNVVFRVKPRAIK